MQDDDGARVRGGDRRDEPVLVARQGERRTIHPLRRDVVDEHHGDVGRTCDRHCLRNQRLIRRLPAETERGSAERRPDRVLDDDRHRHASGQVDQAVRAEGRGARKAEPGGIHYLGVAPRDQRSVDQQSRDAGGVEREAVRPRSGRRECAGPARRVQPGGERVVEVERRADEGSARRTELVHASSSTCRADLDRVPSKA